MAEDLTGPVRRLTEEGFVGGNRAVVDDVLASNYVDHDPLPGMTGHDGLKQMIDMVVTAFQDCAIRSEEMHIAGDKVIENWTFEGTYSGETLGIPPSNKRVNIRGIEIWRVAQGKITERWGVIDMSALTQP